MANIIENIYKKIFNPNYDPETAGDGEKSEAKSTVLGAFVVFLVYTAVIFFIGRCSAGWFSGSDADENTETAIEQVDEDDSTSGELAKADNKKQTTKKKSTKKKTSTKKKSSKSSDSNSSNQKSSKKKKKSNFFSPSDNNDDIYN